MKRWQSLLLWGGLTLAVVAVHYLGRAGLVSGYFLQILQLIGINIMLTASLNLVNGYLGEFAIGHAGFMAVGAYVSALFTVKWHLPFPLALLAGAVAAGLFAWLVGIPAFTTFGDYLAIITLGFNMIVVNLINNIEYLGGPRGLPGLPRATNLLWVYALTALSLLVLRNLVRSNYGRLWVAIRESDIAAELMGAEVRRLRLLALVIAGTIAGAAGALWGHLLQFIHPRSFDYIKSTEMLVMVYLGGMGSLTGSVLGATLYTALMEMLRGLKEWRPVVGPLILILIMLRMPRGLMGLRLPDLSRLLRLRREKGVAT
ncbi:MAG: branched-chain amino acid ABC transporter permease [Bacillota bacterium]